MINLVITGSHLTPAEALIETLPAGFKVHRISSPDGPKFKRYDWWGSLGGLIKLPGLVGRAKTSLQLIKADAVVSFGGFSSVPVCLAAKWLGLPLLVHEQTFGAGLAAKITGPLADIVAISWKSSFKYFSRQKTFLIGNPLRREILKVARLVKPVIYIGGGHQGSQIINETVAAVIDQILAKATVYHQFGRLRRPTARQNYLTKPYFRVKELAKIYAQAQVVVSRAGINTVTELAYLKIPAVLIPLPYTQKNEQAVNARYLEKLGLAVVLPQDQLTPEKLLAAIGQAATLRAAGKIFPRERVKNAAKNLCRLVVKLSRET